jgi:DNA repair/transcription protein MET18/MMS19
MEKIERAIRTWIATQDEHQIAETVSGQLTFTSESATVSYMITEISDGNATLIVVVKALGQYLTSEEDSLRTKG